MHDIFQKKIRSIQWSKVGFENIASILFFSKVTLEHAPFNGGHLRYPLLFDAL